MLLLGDVAEWVSDAGNADQRCEEELDAIFEHLMSCVQIEPVSLLQGLQPAAAMLECGGAAGPGQVYH